MGHVFSGANHRGLHLVLSNYFFRTIDIIGVAHSSAPMDPKCTVRILDRSVCGFKFCRVGSLGDAKWTEEELYFKILVDALESCV